MKTALRAGRFAKPRNPRNPRQNLFLFRSGAARSVILLLLIPLAAGCGGKSAGAPSASSPAGLPVTQVTVTGGGQTYTLSAEVATTPEQRAAGLMNRSSLAADAAMLFVFDDEQTRSFWMKDTPISLDMIFIDSGKTIVDINSNATPDSTTPYVSKAHAKYVLEVAGGWCAGRNINTGDKAAFSGY